MEAPSARAAEPVPPGRGPAPRVGSAGWKVNVEDGGTSFDPFGLTARVNLLGVGVGGGCQSVAVKSPFAGKWGKPSLCLWWVLIIIKLGWWIPSKCAKLVDG